MTSEKQGLILEKRTKSESVNTLDEEKVPNGDRRPYWVEIPIFLYFLAYKGALPMKEQFVYDLFSDALTGWRVTSEHISPSCAYFLNETADLRLGAFQLESSVQERSSVMLSLLNLSRNVPTLFCTLLICSYTDYVGRRWGILLPCLGGALKSACYITVAFYGFRVNYMLYIGEVLEGLGGSITTAQNVAVAYVADVTTEKTRTFRFTIVQSLAIMLWKCSGMRDYWPYHQQPWLHRVLLVHASTLHDCSLTVDILALLLKYRGKGFFCLTIGLWTRCFSDSMIAVFGAVAGAVCQVVQGLTNTTIELWMVAIISIPAAVVLPMAQSIMSTLVLQSERGQLFASLGVLEVFSDMFAGTVLDLIYSATYRIFPGTVFLVMAGMYTIITICFLVVWSLLRTIHKTKKPLAVKEIEINQSV